MIVVQMVGCDSAVFEADHVHTIDVWYSARRNIWVVERLSVEGHHIGHAAEFGSEDDARVCLAEWLRAHAETAFATPRVEKRRAKATQSVRRAA